MALSSLYGTFVGLFMLVTLITIGTTLVSASGIVAFSLYGAIIIILHLAHLLISIFKKESANLVISSFNKYFIFFLITFSYAPIYLLILPPSWGWSLLGASFALTIIGILFRISKKDSLHELSFYTLILLDWLVVLSFFPLHDQVPFSILQFLTLGSAFYTLAIQKSENILNSKNIFAPKYKIFSSPIFWLIAGHISHFAFLSSYIGAM